MKQIAFLCLICNSFLEPSTAQNQSVKGKWYGTGFVKSAVESNNYLTELVVEGNSNNIVASFNFYFRDSLFKNTITGIYSEATRKLLLYKQPIIYYKSSNTKIGIDCYLKSDFTYRTSKVEESLSGVLYPEKNQQFTCPEIYFSFKREAIEKTKDLSAKTIEITDTTVLLEEELAFAKRELAVTKTIEIESDIIEIELTDNGEIDGDIVSIFLDGKLLISKKNLSYKPIVYTIDLKEKKDQFVVSMYAENTGLIAPNTALMVIKDGTKKYELEISSSLSSTTGIALKRKKK